MGQKKKKKKRAYLGENPTVNQNLKLALFERGEAFASVLR